jgi:hypothetical protein
MTDRPGFMRIVKFCKWVDLSPATVHRLCRRGALHKVKVGGASLIEMASWHELTREGIGGRCAKRSPSPMEGRSNDQALHCNEAVRRRLAGQHPRHG